MIFHLLYIANDDATATLGIRSIKRKWGDEVCATRARDSAEARKHIIWNAPPYELIVSDFSYKGLRTDWGGAESWELASRYMSTIPFYFHCTMPKDFVFDEIRKMNLEPVRDEFFFDRRDASLADVIEIARQQEPFIMAHPAFANRPPPTPQLG